MSALMERRRPGATTGRLTTVLAAKFTLAEQAFLAVVAVEVSKRGPAVVHLAALAGISGTNVRTALLECEALGLVALDRRRRSPWINQPDGIWICSKERLLWLRPRRVLVRTSREYKRLRDEGKESFSLLP